MQGHADHAARGQWDSLDRVHELSHEEQPTSIFAVDIARNRWVDQRRVDVEAGTFIANLHDESFGVDKCANVDVLGGIVSIAAENRVGNGFGECDGHVQRDLTPIESHELAFAANQFNDTLDEAYVAGNIDLDDSDFVARF